MPIELDSRRLSEFAKLLKKSPRRRVSEEKLWTMFAKAFPGRPQGAEERRWFVACLEEMQQRGFLRLPSTRGRRWDRALGIAVPTSVDLVRPERPTPNQSWRTFPWHPSLNWVPDLRQPTVSQLEFLSRVHEGLVTGQFDKRVPVKYRSLQLTGDEKGLDRLSSTRLFEPGKIDLDLLGCFSDVVPLAWESVSDKPAILIFENAGPFAVARGLLAQMQDPPYGIVGYGGGTRLDSSIPHLSTLGRPLETIHYVGDLDLRGLQIAVSAKKAALATGLPALTAAPGMHAAMLKSCERFGYPQGWPIARRTMERSAPAVNERHLSFLPAEVRDAVREILDAGRRVPEEVLGPEEMEEVWNSKSVIEQIRIL